MNLPNVDTTAFQLRGGLNQVTPPLSMPDGTCRDMLNFEAASDGGYSWPAGYERYDGRSAPSLASYSSLPMAVITSAPAKGATIVGVISGATAKVIRSDTDRLIICQITGTFNSSGESLTVSGTPIGACSGQPSAGGASTNKDDAFLTSEAADFARALIQAVPGTGPVRGVWFFNGVVYAFRDKVGGINAGMYRSSSGGWVEVNLNHQVSFSAANTNVNEGDTLTQGGVTATILRVVVQTGTLASGTNTGRLIISAPTGGTFAAGAATSTGSGTLTLTGASAAITLASGGTYEFETYNFTGSPSTRRMYGVSGANNAFEFDGTVYVPLVTGMTDDRPSHIACHQKHLWLTFGGSLQRSAVGNPYSFSVILGAAEFALGDNITQLLPMTGSSTDAAMAVFSRNSTMMLYGASEADFKLLSLNAEAGAVAFTARTLTDVYLLDEPGIRTLSASQNYGNFDDSQISWPVRPWLEGKNSLAVGAVIVRKKNQYRLYFSDGSALYTTFRNGKVIGMTPMSFAHQFYSVVSFESDEDVDRMYAAGTDGFVYSLDKGTSFDGQDINGNALLSFSFSKRPRVKKAYKYAFFELTGSSYAEFDLSYELGYADPSAVQGPDFTSTSNLGAVFWDGFTWDSFYWDGRTLAPVRLKLNGSAINISLVIRASSKYLKPFTFNSVIIHNIPRRLSR